MSIVKVSPTVRRKKRGTPVYSGGVLRSSPSVASAIDGLGKLNTTSSFDQQVEELRKRWRL
jgi:hypothetical protein